MAHRCGTCHPPADGTKDREALDRFSDFLRAVGGPPVSKADLDAGRYRLRPPAERYRLRLAAWRCGPESMALAERFHLIERRRTA
jgi:hypothetical protein